MDFGNVRAGANVPDPMCSTMVGLDPAGFGGIRSVPRLPSRQCAGAPQRASRSWTSGAVKRVTKAGLWGGGSAFGPSGSFDKTHAILATAAVVADTDEAAERLAATVDLDDVHSTRGIYGPLESPDASVTAFHPREEAAHSTNRSRVFVGSPTRVRDFFVIRRGVRRRGRMIAGGPNEIDRTDPLPQVGEALLGNRCRSIISVCSELSGDEQVPSRPSGCMDTGFNAGMLRRCAQNLNPGFPTIPDKRTKEYARRLQLPQIIQPRGSPHSREEARETTWMCDGMSASRPPINCAAALKLRRSSVSSNLKISNRRGTSSVT